MIAAGGHRAASDQRVVGDDLRPDESSSDVAVDFARRQLRRRVARDRPGPALVLADREERNVAEQIVAGANHAIEARGAQPEICEKRPGVGRVELRDLELDLAADGDRGRRCVRQECREAGRARRVVDVGRRVAAPCQLRFVEVDDDQQRLR